MTVFRVLRPFEDYISCVIVYVDRNFDYKTLLIRTLLSQGLTSLGEECDG